MSDGEAGSAIIAALYYKMKKGPNKAMEPIPVNVTVPADAGPAPFTSMAHLWRCAKNMSDLQHIAYEVSLKSLLEAKQRAVQDFLGQVDCYDPEDLDDLDTVILGVERAFELCHQAQKIARQMMQAHDYSKATELLKKRLPGYSDETYAQAVSEAFARQAR